MNTNQKMDFSFQMKSGETILIPVEIRNHDKETVVILSAPQLESFKLEHQYSSVAIQIMKQFLEGRDLKKVKWVLFMPVFGEEGACFLIQPSHDPIQGGYRKDGMDAFGICKGYLPEGVIPISRDGSQCNVTYHIGF